MGVQFCRKLIIKGDWVPRHKRTAYRLIFVFFSIIILNIKFEVISRSFDLGFNSVT